MSMCKTSFSPQSAAASFPVAILSGCLESFDATDVIDGMRPMLTGGKMIIRSLDPFIEKTWMGGIRAWSGWQEAGIHARMRQIIYIPCLLSKLCYVIGVTICKSRGMRQIITVKGKKIC